MSENPTSHSKTTTLNEEDAKPFWTIELSFESIAGRDRAFSRIQDTLQEMGLGHISLHKWDPVQ